ncbi:ATP-dependent helicase [Candidatus Pacearchaeota archaeon CG10_big_fil_rev_8_21_14_0_10_31_24]|nr:MAG: ATP-dependent helicase [Candidatus Pacearchaeota archaeon CG10_big_fil_rev_8_21_14_0_10_31_24]
MTETNEIKVQFENLGVNKDVLRTLDELKITVPTQIQAEAIPLSLEGKDIIAGSATGSGKTLAFGINILQKVVPGKGIQALVITPTRELAEQVGRVFQKFTRHSEIKTAIVYGASGMSPQIRALRHSEIVVGTPGRLLDHLRQENFNLKTLKILVLDEADRMLDMGFIEDVSKIISQCPKERQTLLFSATISPDIKHISKKYLHLPVEISVDSYVDPSKLTQIYYDVPQSLKFSLLTHLLKSEKSGLVMVFCNTRHNTDFVARNLKKEGLYAQAIHGGLAQSKRNRVLESFHKGQALILVCTDVAARGLDIKNVSHVYNYDIPANSKEYVHRIGRTARAGKEGIAVNIVSARDYENFRMVLSNSDLKIKEEPIPEVQRVSIIRSEDRFHDNRRDRGSLGNRRMRHNTERPSRSNSEGSENSSERRSYGSRSSSRGSPRSYGSRSSSRSGPRRESSERSYKPSSSYRR